MSRWIRTIHLVMTSIVGAQLVVWTVTGFAFTLFDFGVVRGTGDRALPDPIALGAVAVRAEEAARIASSRASGGKVKSITLEALAGRPTYTVAFVGEKKEILVDAATAAVAGVDSDLAARIAVSAFRGHARARSVDRRSNDDRDTFVVRLDDARDTEVTVDAATGAVTAWQNRSFRFFDALWSAHVLGYLDRTSPANWPLRGVAFLALIAAASGTGLLLVRLRQRLADLRSPARPRLTGALSDGST
jgi:uncharacterized membrane protein YkoI